MFQDIANAWKGLETAEKGFEEWLLSELQRYGNSLSFHFYIEWPTIHIQESTSKKTEKVQDIKSYILVKIKNLTRNQHIKI